MRVLITGAGSGIGFQLALKLSGIPAIQVTAISRNIEHLHNLQDDSLGKIQIVAADIALENPDVYLREFLIQGRDKVDVLVNNAAQLVNKPFMSLTDNEWKELFEINVFSVVRICRHVIPFMGSGAHIVNIGSIGGMTSTPKFSGLSAYSASKAALLTMGECLSEELREKGIAVNGLALGAVQTEMLGKAFPGYKAPIDAESMGGFIADFVINGQRFFNGKVIPVSLSTP